MRSRIVTNHPWLCSTRSSSVRHFCTSNSAQPPKNNIALETPKDLKNALRKTYWRLKMRTLGLSVISLSAFVFEFYPISVVSSLLTFHSWMGSKTHPLHSQLVLSMSLSSTDHTEVEITTYKGKKIRAKVDTILPATEILPAYRALEQRLGKKSTESSSIQDNENSTGQTEQKIADFESDELQPGIKKFFSAGDPGRNKLMNSFVETVRDDINGFYADVELGTTLKFVDYPDHFFFYFRVAEKPFLVSFHYADTENKIDTELLFKILNGNRPLKLRKEIDLTKLVSREEEEYFMLGGKKPQEIAPTQQPLAQLEDSPTAPPRHTQ